MSEFLLATIILVFGAGCCGLIRLAVEYEVCPFWFAAILTLIIILSSGWLIAEIATCYPSLRCGLFGAVTQ